MRAVITGTGMYVPPNVVDNDRLSRVMDTSDEWVRQRTGIVTRHFADENQATSDLAVHAARDALADSGTSADEIDYVVFATMSPDLYFPGSGPILQHIAESILAQSNDNNTDLIGPQILWPGTPRRIDSNQHALHLWRLLMQEPAFIEQFRCPQ